MIIIFRGSEWLAVKSGMNVEGQTWLSSPPSLSMLLNMSKGELQQLLTRGGLTLGASTSIAKLAETVLVNWDAIKNITGASSVSTTSIKGPSRSELMKQAMDLGISKINLHRAGELVLTKSGQPKLVDVSNREVTNADISIAINKVMQTQVTDICLKLM